MAARSKRLWDGRLATANAADAVNADTVDWLSNGSMLVASTAEEAGSLKDREMALHNAGVSAAYFDAAAASGLEPSLALSDDGGALLVPGDAQLDGRLTAAAMLRACEAHSPRFHAILGEECESLISGPQRGEVQGLKTRHRNIMARRGVVITAGAWSGEFIARELAAPAWKDALKPRRGHLLELSPPSGMAPLQRGLMEVGYTAHYSPGGKAAAAAAAASPSHTSAVSSSSASSSSSAAAADITFTATTSGNGTLLVGSSREFSGWDPVASMGVVDAIMQRACVFLPELASVNPRNIDVRVGLRPFSPTGPMVGPIQPGLYVAAGHEGSGLTLGPATGELVCDYILDRQFGLSEVAVTALLPNIKV
jgi:glycine/D-amino acid oxidase-like deaminating enzyme